MSDQPNVKPTLKSGPFEEHAIRTSVPVPSTLPSEELQRIEPQPVATRPVPSVGEMLCAVIEKGVTAENVAAIEKLVGLYERMEEKKAEREFAQAFVHLQEIMPKVNATKVVHCKDGSDKYKFAPLEDIVRQVNPSLQKCGFSYSFGEKIVEGDKKVETFTLIHVGGHSRTNEFAVRVGSGPPGCTTTQADGAAGQYARRYALCDGLGIVIEHLDQDARMEGGPITKDQAEELARRVNETESDREKFLKFAGADSFFTIPAAKYAILDEYLSKKERGNR